MCLFLALWITFQLARSANATPNDGPSALLRMQLNVPAAQSNIVAHAKLPYGAMLWGDYSKFSLPADAQIDGASRQFCGGLQTLGDALTTGFHLRAIHLLTL